MAFVMQMGGIRLVRCRQFEFGRKLNRQFVYLANLRTGAKLLRSGSPPNAHPVGSWGGSGKQTYAEFLGTKSRAGRLTVRR
jgi:hypothetical protein